jgi:hypothetical protein
MLPLTDLLSPANRKIFAGLKSPIAIQEYLDSIPYVGEELNRSPLRVMQDRQGHCLDGGLFAAAALRRLNFPPLILDLVPEPGTDDDHVLALFQGRDNLWGAVAKSNFSGLRFREPIFRTLRELAMSYFEAFYNVQGQKTLRGYTRPLLLSAFDHHDWETTESGVEVVNRRLYSMKMIPLISSQAAATLSQVDKRAYDAGMLGVNFDGLYKPKE